MDLSKFGVTGLQAYVTALKRGQTSKQASALAESAEQRVVAGTVLAEIAKRRSALVAHVPLSPVRLRYVR